MDGHPTAQAAAGRTFDRWTGAGAYCTDYDRGRSSAAATLLASEPPTRSYALTLMLVYGDCTSHLAAMSDHH